MPRSMLFDPKLIGSLPSSKFKSISGTPTAGASGITFSSCDVYGYAFFKYLSIAYWLKIPTAPTAGHSRKWGLATYGGGNNGRIEFEITDTTFQAIAYDEDGVAINTIVIPWDASWTNAVVEYKIQWSENGIYFFVNGNKVAAIAVMQRDVNEYPPRLALSEHFKDSVADSPILDRLVYENIQNMI